ncbi:glutaredoxin family protein [Anaerococcus hydrogenalis]|uniref:Glutaredoxin n=2 Tax=Anaerococcus hydrogenalis TaxID=33029 RepID=F0H033_9FIRM|nr:glutathione S-transferase N-terminal domain-containing protein [Anaerococcus hydrogenalis]EGC84206.1 glutaredoxin [Anaerococcus hydrogenalis ACS-025-V-Sch4]MBS5989336.1 glutathione S-transferase N-terminal domain-containing protein [Anaerococcus hydrogenalis]MDK7695789.1 glutathione S-transferase N-terminal domain-containing protein [Anaerococcus hydrogenalis]MDK7697538.1 glutathione S-transferase N-terminal domain-containing protein [Anaerococcus hydrogenalis]MDK7708816.1 glutathione S-tra
MSDYKLFVGSFCPHCRKVENFLDENDIKIDIVNINEDRDAMMELIQKGGKRQVPCLFHDGEYMYESNDIIEFLQK